MATRNKTSSTPVFWLRRIYHRLTSRMACFVWGALFGNALLSQPVEPLNLLLAPPEYMLSSSAQEGLAALRQSMRELGTAFTDAVWERVHAHMRPDDSAPAQERTEH